ncbi:hypothetical protein IJT93_10020 [bacterium]|nr:hypothetical protein [bacterium]
MGYIIVFISFLYGLIAGYPGQSESVLFSFFRFDMSARLSPAEIRNARQAYFYGVVINTIFWCGIAVYAAYLYLMSGGK